MNFIEVINTWFGEGPLMGRRCLLLRFKKCNRHLCYSREKEVPTYYYKKYNKTHCDSIKYHPCPGCDTAVKMKACIEMDISYNEIRNILQKETIPNILLTGGEPTCYLNDSINLITMTHDIVDNINIETNGYKLIELLKQIKLQPISERNKVLITYSPKVMDITDYNEEMEKLIKLGDCKNIILKIVLWNDISKVFLNDILKNHDIHISNNNIWLMPLGATKDEILTSSKICIDLCDEYKLNFSSRMHIIYDFV